MTAAIPVTGTVQHYAWGDPSFLPHLLGQEPDGRPWAELWLGTHPNGPTTFNGGTPLSELAGNLPYLLKVLTAVEPLSMQCHPDAARARIGHAEGRYPDPNAKPELVVALTPFRALCGVRPLEQTDAFLRAAGADDLADVLADEGVAGILELLYRGRFDPGPAIRAVVRSGSDDLRHIIDLDRRYPDDPSVAVAMLLNHVSLRPGEALRLDAGNLHAYLRGCGIELMGASDNVVRGGLTTKLVDVDELLTIVDPTPLVQPVLSVSDGRYPLPEAGVTLVRVDPGVTHTSAGRELVIGLDGQASYLGPGAAWTSDAASYVVVGADALTEPVSN